MARKVEVQLLDDIDGGPADETVQFSLDGTNYEIDLNAKHAEKLRTSLERFVGAGRKLGRGQVVPTRGVRSGGSEPARLDRSQSRAIREWAKRKGIELSPRGRISRNIIERYEAEAGR